jgi:uncharacterized protein YegL
MRTDITVVLDRSGSMQSTRDDAMNGFNALVSDQKTAPGEAWLSLVQFDDQYQVNYTETPMRDVPALTRETYQPRGSTALLDAIGLTIDAVGARLSARDAADRPGKVIVVIITDGMENASRKFTSATISEKIAHQRDVYKWEFVFVGSNQDAIMTAAQMNIGVHDALTFSSTPRGTDRAYSAIASSLSARRLDKSGAFTQEQRDEANETN